MRAHIHPIATDGFGREETVEAYERARPSFPADAVEFLIQTLGLEQSTRVADLGAGTGKLTRLLTTSGAHVVGVEPIYEMRKAFHAGLPDTALIGAVAEALPFRHGSFDAVFAAQAFHWFDGPRALTEIHATLRAGGRLALVWNSRDESVPWVRRLTEFMEPYRGDAPAQASLAWKAAFEADARFSALEHAEFGYSHELGVEGVVDRIASVSFVAALAREERAGLLDRVRTLAAAEPQPVVLPYRTHLYWTERR